MPVDDKLLASFTDKALMDLLKRSHLAILGQLMMMTGCGPSHTVARGLWRVTWICYISPEYLTIVTDHLNFLNNRHVDVKAHQNGF